MRDPSRDEMLEFLHSQFVGEELSDDMEAAIYWFAAHYHSGQWSNLYVALCASPFDPGPLGDGPDGFGETLVYEALVDEFGGPSIDKGA